MMDGRPTVVDVPQDCRSTRDSYLDSALTDPTPHTTLAWATTMRVAST
ncbi:hypothetical protein GPOL_c29050 [Gordonia polyisoprenivorans VH2]|uniref:Uncharacterized protein n=1 Tax=Gordonia polyisoprenivorans (strain DSM 44266 / VH2) TaxID=1112204 RepID=H6MTP7_GORPV|nr:hypothetical protein GPOL_c29050 [Gordonia polyisoprenivorans VH2]